MKLGRDYTNCLVFEHLSDEEKRAFERGEIDLGSMNALALEKAKLDVQKQIDVTLELGLQHIELDADSPNPYLRLDEKQRNDIRNMAEDSGISLSLHLPYSYVGGSICSLQGTDRRMAVDLCKECMRFAADIGAESVNVHPGSAPFYQRYGRYMEQIRASLFKSLLDLSKYAKELGLCLLLENNTAFDGIFSEVGECLSLISELREKNAEIYFNFDIGHWFTRADVGQEIPNPPESIMEQIPPDFIKELHLNDYVPVEKMFHPPLHLELGLLKFGNLQRYARIVKMKRVELIVLETSLKSVEQVLHWEEFLKRETDFVKQIFD
ncbi:MAG: sugar phosphate isomerase/epimerase family protein [Candidatus Hadarchaeales archaeon]